jgi:hypothetical protein
MGVVWLLGKEEDRTRRRTTGDGLVAMGVEWLRGKEEGRTRRRTTGDELADRTELVSELMEAVDHRLLFPCPCILVVVAPPPPPPPPPPPLLSTPRAAL